MPSFSDSIVLFVLALLLFGPKKLPVLAREIGKWVGEFRRASNEFKMQMEDELRASEQADRAKTIAAMEAAAPQAPVIAEPEHPHLPAPDPGFVSHEGEVPPAESDLPATEHVVSVQPLPIATEGDLSLMPPATGLPVPRRGTPLGALLESIPVVETSDAVQTADAPKSPEVAHG